MPVKREKEKIKQDFLKESVRGNYPKCLFNVGPLHPFVVDDISYYVGV